MAMKPDAYMLHPAEFDAVDEDGHPTGDGMLLIHELKEHARSLEARFGVLRGRMRDYEQWWTQQAPIWSGGTDKELADTLPGFPSSKGRVLIAKAVRANVKERVGFKIALSADWTQEQTDATQKLERYCMGALWMADIERQARALGQVQPALAWFAAARGAAIAIPFVRSSNRSKDGDGYGDLEPYIIRTPDPLICVWDESAYGLTFYASIDWRPQSDFYGMTGLDTLRPSQKPGHTDECETVNVWWCDCDQNVWNATIAENCFLIPPTNHTARRKLKRLPVIIDGPAFGSPKEAMIRDSDTESLADHYRGVLENNLYAYMVEGRIDAIQMRLMKDAAQRMAWISSQRTFNVEELKEAAKGNAMLMLGPDGRAGILDAPQLSDSVARWEQKLDGLQQQGGMPATAIAGVQAGMTGVAIQEAILQGEFAAGPISDMLKRVHEEIARCLIAQHRALPKRTVKVQGQERSGMFVPFRVEASQLPPPDEYMLQAIHSPFLVRDGYRDAQEAMTWRNAGRSFEAIADDKFQDPTREVSLARQEQLQKNPVVALALELEEALSRYGPSSVAVKVLGSALQQALAQAVPQGQPAPTNAPQPGAAMDAAPMPQLPGGPPTPAPAGVNPEEMADQQMLGQMGREQGGFNGY